MKVFLANPRGFCAGVERAIQIVEQALELYGAPVYVRHEIVHNKRVLNNLRKKGAIFVEELNEIPDGKITIFSAHGVPKVVVKNAQERDLPTIDATCPLVTKVHLNAQRAEKNGHQIILIGHKGHPEVTGTSGQVNSEVFIVSSPEDVKHLQVTDPQKLSYVTQTTLSVDETTDIIAALKGKFPQIKGPDLKDICYATQNRQNAVKDLAKVCDLILVVGAKNSSNSNRLRDLGEYCGATSILVDSVHELEHKWFESAQNVGITAGASAPEELIEEILQELKTHYNAQIEELSGVKEDINFKLPKEVTSHPYQA